MEARTLRVLCSVTKQRDCQEDAPGSGAWAQPQVRLPTPSDRLGGAPARTHQPAWDAVSLAVAAGMACGPQRLLAAHQRGIVDIAAATEQQQPIRAGGGGCIHARAWRLASRLDSLPLVRLHRRVQGPRVGEGLGCRWANGVSVGQRDGRVIWSSVRMPCSRRCRPGPAGSAGRRAPARGRSELPAPRLGPPATGKGVSPGLYRSAGVSETSPIGRAVRTTRCQRGVPARSRTNRSSVASPAGPMPPCRRGWRRTQSVTRRRHVVWRQAERACMTTILPTAVAA